MDVLLPEKLKVLWQSVEAGAQSEDDYERLKQECFDQYKAAWSLAVLLPGMFDLKTSMLTELARYTGCADLTEIERRCRRAPDDMASEWDRGVKESDRASVEHFYDSSAAEIYGLAWWHILEEDLTPLSYVVASEFARERGCRSYLDFGSGIGSGALVFGGDAPSGVASRQPMETTCADISSPMLEFCRFRQEIRGRSGRFVDLRHDALPVRAYDFITAMDVFEHLYDPVEAIERLHDALRPGGYIFGRWAIEEHDERRGHIVRDLRPTFRRMEELGLVEVWRDDWIWGHQIFQKQ
jgi:SAM-dependent methyltransferase